MNSQERLAKNEQPKNNIKGKKIIKNKTIVIVSCIFAIISIIWSIRMISLSASRAYTYQTWALSSLFDALIVSALFIISLISSGVAFYTSKKVKNKNYMIISIFCLICSFIPVITYPISDQMARESARKTEQAMQEKEAAEQAAKEAYRTEPSITEQITSYTDCFSYKNNKKYIGARDAICGYLRYTYSNDWQEPLTSKQLLESGYIPKYYQYSKRGDTPLVINNQAYELEISRDNGRLFLLTPHQSCLKEKDDSLISVWYLDNEEFVCMYYDYRKDTAFAEPNEYKNTSINIYSSEFKEPYENLIKMLYNKSVNNPDYSFSIEYQGEYEDDYEMDTNDSFLKSFFSAWPEDYFAN